MYEHIKFKPSCSYGNVEAESTSEERGCQTGGGFMREGPSGFIGARLTSGLLSDSPPPHRTITRHRIRWVALWPVGAESYCVA